MERILKISINSSEAPIYKLGTRFTQGDSKSHILEIEFKDEIDFSNKKLKVNFIRADDVVVTTIQSQLSKITTIEVPTNALSVVGELGIELVVFQNDKILTINKRIKLRVIETTAGKGNTVILGDNFLNDIHKVTQELLNILNGKAEEQIKIIINKTSEHIKKIIDNIAEQKTTMKLQPNITRYQLPSTWIITDKTEVYINGLLISKEMYRIENYELILNDSLSDEADLVVKISLPSTYIEELKNTAKEDIDNYITEKKKELKGDKGTTFKPSVDNLGNLTWSNDDGLPNPPVVNIRGPQGKPGVPGRDGEQGLPGKNGEDGKDLTVEVQGTIGMKFDENLRFLNDVGAKKKGFCYFDKLTDGVFECKENTEITVNDTRYFKNISSKTNSDYINNLFGNVRLYNQDSINIADNLFNTSITKIVGVKLTVEADKFASSDNALVTFNYTKLLKKCCFANLIFTSPRGAWLGSSLENNVNVRLQYLDSVQLVLGVIGNNKREKIDLYLALYGN